MSFHSTPVFFQIGGYFFTTKFTPHDLLVGRFFADSKGGCPGGETNTAASYELKMLVGGPRAKQER